MPPIHTLLLVFLKTLSLAEYPTSTQDKYEIHPRLSDGEETINRTNVCETEKPCKHGECRWNHWVGNYNCWCTFPWVGTNCTIERECLTTGCHSHGTCMNLTSSAGLPYSRCKCTAPWRGWNCEVDAAACYEDDIECSGQSAGRCTFSTTTKPACACKTGFKGDKCQFLANSTDIQSSTWGWGYTFLIIVALLAVVVGTQQIWQCFSRKVRKLQGREGFSLVAQELEDDEARQIGEFGDIEMVEEIGHGIGDLGDTK